MRKTLLARLCHFYSSDIALTLALATHSNFGIYSQRHEFICWISWLLASHIMARTAHDQYSGNAAGKSCIQQLVLSLSTSSKWISLRNSMIFSVGCHNKISTSFHWLPVYSSVLVFKALFPLLLFPSSSGWVSSDALVAVATGFFDGQCLRSEWKSRECIS